MQGCTLKQQSVSSSSAIIPEAYSRGPNVTYTSGVVQRADSSIIQHSTDVSVPIGMAGSPLCALCSPESKSHKQLCVGDKIILLPV